MQTIIGLDIGGTKTAVVEGTAEAKILQRHEFPTEAHRPFAEIFPRLAQLIDQTISAAVGSGRRPVALSVSIGGPLRIKEGLLLNPTHLPGWHGVHLRKTLSEQYPQLPVFIEHDGNAGALAEFHFGVGRGRANLRDLIFLTFGTGIGAGLIINGQIVHGASDTAGEIGHLRLAPDGPLLYGKRGSWEGFSSGKGLVKLAAQMFPRRWTDETPIRDLVNAMLADDEEAMKVATEAGAWLGRGLAILVDILNPQIIVLGSLAVALGERVLEPARRALRDEALPQAVAACEILPAALGSNIGNVAALMAALTSPEISIPSPTHVIKP